MKPSFLLLFVLLAASFLTQAQDSTATKTKTATVFLKDGTQLRGSLISESADLIRIRTDNLGELSISLDKIEKIERYTAGYYKNGHFWPENPHSTRYFWAPSALPLRKGEAYYQNAYIFVNSVSVGVTDQFTMGGGFVLNPTFRDWQVLFITPKISFPSQGNVTFGAGVIAVGVFNRQYTYDYQNPYSSRSSRIKTNLAGIAYGNVTFGDVERNTSLGLGWAFANDEFSARPVLNVSHMKRIGKKTGFVTENWIIVPGGGDSALALLSGGVRIFGERTSVDLALWVPAGVGSFVVIPYVDFVLKFGK